MNTEIGSMIDQLLSASNDQRLSAERLMKDSRASNSEKLLQGLVEYIVSAGADATKQNQASLAALLLKKQYLDERIEEEGQWQISNTHATELKNTMSSSIDFQNQSKLLLQRKADIICKCFRKLETYEEMIQNLVALLKLTDGTPQENVARKQFAMYNFEILSEYHLSQEVIVEHSGQFLELFQSTLKEEDSHVKVAALKAITAFLTSIDDDDVVLKYKGMMEGLLDVVIAVMQQDEQQGQASLESMIELTQLHGDVWADCLSKLIFVVTQIMKNREFEDATRQSALELVNTIAENMSATLRKHQSDLNEHLFPAIAFMMTEVVHEDDLETWYEEEDTELQAKNDPASVAADSLQRLSVFLGEKTTLACTSSLIKAAIDSPNWKEKCMGFVFLGQISEACKKSFLSNMDDVAKMSASGFTHENPRVRYDALQSTGLLLNDLAPKFQTKYHQDLIPVLVSMMNSETKLKMQTQATACMTSLIRGLIDEESAEDSEINVANKKILVPYAEQIVKSISALFQKSIDSKYQPLQEEVLVTLSSMAAVMDTNFEPFYGTFMPGLKHILKTVKWETQQEQELRSNCIEATGYILTSVKDKPEVCKADAIEICQMIIETLINGNLVDSDPQITSIANVISQIAVCLKEEFVQFLPLIVPALLKDAQRDIDFKIIDADETNVEGDEADHKDGIQTLNLKVKGLEGAKQVSMNTNVLEVKINAIQILKNLARNLGTNFYSHVEDVAQVCIQKLLQDPYSYMIRKESAKCMRFCIAACEAYPDKQKALYIMTYVKLMEELEKRKTRKEFDMINAILKELFKQLKLFQGFKAKGITVYTQEDAVTFINRVKEIHDLIKADKAERMQKIKVMAKGKVVDEEDLEYFEEDLEKVDKGIHHIMEINGFLMQNMGELVSAHVGSTLLPGYAQVLLNINDKKIYELVDSVCMICDCMEHGTPALFQQIQAQAGSKFVELIHYGSKDQSDIKYDLLQSAVFGLGLIAQRQENGQFAVLGDFIKILGHTISTDIPDGMDEDQKDQKLCLADNSVSSLTKIIMFQYDGGNLVKDELCSTILSQKLPLTHDIDEAQAIHSLILEQIQAKNAVLMKNAEAIKGFVQKLQEYSQTHTEAEEDILGEEGKKLLEQVVAQM